MSIRTLILYLTIGPRHVIIGFCAIPIPVAPYANGGAGSAFRGPKMNRAYSHAFVAHDLPRKPLCFQLIDKRVRNALKKSVLKSLYLQSHAHSFAANPAVSALSQNGVGGVYTRHLSHSFLSTSPSAIRLAPRASRHNLILFAARAYTAPSASRSRARPSASAISASDGQ